MTPILGQTIKALRHGYHWLPEKQCFLRVEGDGPFKITIRPTPPENNTKRHHNPTPYRVWWSGPDQALFREMLLSTPAIKSLPTNPPFTILYLDDNGNRV